jgi:hypothetical protein
MECEEFTFVIAADDRAAESSAAQALSDLLRETEGVLEVNRRKADRDTMDLGAIVAAIAASGSTLAIAQGVAAWLRARRGASITIERQAGCESIKAAVAGIDSQAAIRITEIVLSQSKG